MQQIVDALNSLWGAPSFVLVGVACIVLAYIPRTIPAFPNKWIPAVLILLLGPGLNLLMTEARAPKETVRFWWAQNYVIGLVVGWLAWMLHDRLISKLEDWLATKVPFVGNLLNSGKPPEPPTPPTPPAP